MGVPLSLLGVLAGWLLVLVAGAAFGYVLVVGWQRWGLSPRVPDGIKPVAARVLGPPQRPASALEPAAPVAPETAPEWDRDEAEGGSDAEVRFQPEEHEDEAGEEDRTPTPEPEQEHTTAPADRTAPAYTLSRADAIEELSLLFDARYEEAKALVKSGLWGMENHEEWVRAMRGKAAPDNVDDPLFQRVVGAHPQSYEKPLAQLREKQASLRQLQTLWGVGPHEAEALYQAGYRDLEAIRTAASDKLAKIPGIGHALAFQMRAAAHRLAPTA